MMAVGLSKAESGEYINKLQEESRGALVDVTCVNVNNPKNTTFSTFSGDEAQIGRLGSLI